VLLRQFSEDFMDSYHRQPRRKEQPSGRDCQFCAALDPNFTKRDPLDRWVQGVPQDSAIAHVSENGHVLHLIFEIERKRAQTPSRSATLVKSA
jgi:hypothetical protein